MVEAFPLSWGVIGPRKVRMTQLIAGSLLLAVVKVVKDRRVAVPMVRYAHVGIPLRIFTLRPARRTEVVQIIFPVAHLGNGGRRVADNIRVIDCVPGPVGVRDQAVVGIAFVGARPKAVLLRAIGQDQVGQFMSWLAHPPSVKVAFVPPTKSKSYCLAWSDWSRGSGKKELVRRVTRTLVGERNNLEIRNLAAMSK